MFTVIYEYYPRTPPLLPTRVVDGSALTAVGRPTPPEAGRPAVSGWGPGLNPDGFPLLWLADPLHQRQLAGEPLTADLRPLNLCSECSMRKTLGAPVVNTLHGVTGTLRPLSSGTPEAGICSVSADALGSSLQELCHFLLRVLVSPSFTSKVHLQIQTPLSPLLGGGGGGFGGRGGFGNWGGCEPRPYIRCARRNCASL